jgi:DNA-directed RNA polymerase subunit RPC12/RpoP
MLIDCPYCRSRVDAKEHGKYSEPRHPEDYYDAPDTRIVLSACPRCSSALVGKQEEHEHPDYGSYWADAERLWPEPKRVVAHSVPDIVRMSLDEADICFRGGAFAACAVMCGRSLEGVCVHFGAGESLATGLKSLLEKNVIDQRLFTWGEELRKARNLGAHATTEKVPIEDARDVLDFAHAITEYVFVLNEKFDRFMKRRSDGAGTPS